MTPQEYTQWLDGYLTDKNSELNAQQVKTIKEKLQTVFNKVTPNIGSCNNQLLLNTTIFPLIPNSTVIESPLPVISC